MKKFKNIVFILILFMCKNVVFSQKSDENSTKYKESSSSVSLIAEYSKKIDKGDVLSDQENKELAKAYFNINQFSKALPYLLVIDSTSFNNDLLFMLNHAYKSNKDFELGNKNLKTYFDNNKINYDQYLNDLLALKTLGNRYDIKSIKKINKKTSELFNYEDENYIYYSSDEKKNNLTEKKSASNINNFYNEYQMSKKDSTITSIGLVNTNYHDSNIVYVLDKNVAYMASNEINEDSFVKKGSVVQLSIYYLLFNRKKDMIVRKECLPFNSTTYSCKNPFYNKENGLLYFSSNMPGGKGGYDIYSYDIRNPKSLKNIAEINTINDENDVFIDSKKNIYFSSNGYFGFGGLDIFVRQFDSKTKKYKRVMNIGLPINSREDDFGFYIKDKKGYYSSKISSNDDIYAFTETKPLDLDKISYFLKGQVINISGEVLPKVEIQLVNSSGEKTILKQTSTGNFNQEVSDTKYTLEMDNEDYELVTKKIVLNSEKYSITEQNIEIKKSPCMTTYSGIVFNNTKKVPLSGVKVFITDLNKNEITSVLTDKKGFYSISVPCNQKYVFRTFSECKSPYFPNYIEYMAVTELKKVKKDINFNEVSICGLLVNEKGELLIETNPILFATNKYNISSEAKIELAKVLEILKYNPNYNLIVKSHTDNRGTDENNMKLSENRAKSTMNYIISQGISKERIQYAFYGESMPLIDCKEICSDLELSKNRRSEFEIKEVITPTKFNN